MALLSLGCPVSDSPISRLPGCPIRFLWSPSTLIPFIQVPLISGLFLLPYLLVILSPVYPFSGSPCNWIPYLKVPSSSSFSHFGVPLSLGCPISGSSCNWIPYLKVPPSPSSSNFWVVLSLGLLVTGFPISSPPILMFPCFLVLVLNSRPTSGGICSLCYLLYS